MEYQHWTIKEAMQRIGAKKLYLPAIQRKFVWDALQIERLFDSIMRDYPIGTFLFWMVEEAKHNDYSFYEFIREYHERDHKKNSLAAKPHLPDELVGVLDGQQRLNSMYVALQGTYAYKRPRVWVNNPNAYPVRKFYLNVFKPEVEREDEDYIYEFCFLTPEDAKEITPETCWCLVKDLLECKGVPEVNKYWTKQKKLIPKEAEVPEETDDRALGILGKLWERLTTIPIINYYPVKNQNLDEVLDIFVRVNSAGTPLAKTDLLFSTIVAQWEDGREAIEEFLEKLNKKGNGFWFDTDFIMRACLVLAECPVRLRVASFKAENVKLIVNSWKLITTAINRAVDLLVEWGFEGATLPSTNAVIPIAYAIKHNCDVKASKADLRLLLIKSILTGVYGGSGDQVLSSIRKGMEETVKAGIAFELENLEKTVRLPGGKSFVINEETLDDLLLSTKGARSFALLSLLTSHLKFDQVQFHQDHIHPHAGFNTTTLRKLGLNDDQIGEWQAKRDMLANLHLLEGKENQSKLATPFEVWLKKECPKDADRTNYLRSHHIPDLSLELSNFGEFFEKRRVLLKGKLAELLDVPVKENLDAQRPMILQQQTMPPPITVVPIWRYKKAVAAQEGKDTAAVSSVSHKELLNKIIENLLKSISLDESKVKCHHRPLSYYIQTTYPAIERICLGLNVKGNEIILALCFGDSPRQAKAFYNSKINIGHLNKTEWGISPNFHVSFKASNLVRFESEDSEHYLQFWKNNIEKIHQQKRGAVKKYFEWLVDKKVITMTKDAKEQLDEKFFNTKRQTLNICPGFQLNFTFNISEAEELDKLKVILAEKIREGLKVVELDGNEVLKKF